MLLLTTIASAAPGVRVEPGVYPYGAGEVWLGGFVLDRRAGAPGSCEEAGRTLPTAEERAVAARSSAFRPGDRWEALSAPGDERCGYSQAVVEAEGVEGWIWFAGWGRHLGSSEVITGAGDPRTGVIRIHSNPWHFWGDEHKPAPHGERCVVRDPVVSEVAYVDASSLNLRAGRGPAFPVVHRLDAGTKVEVWHREGEHAWVSAGKTVPDTSGSVPWTWTCTVSGWVGAEYLSTSPPDVLRYVREAEAALAAGRAADAVAPLERAAALHIGNAALREALAEIYTATSHASAEATTAQASELRARSPVVPFTDRDGKVDLATLCRGDPLTARWIASPRPIASGDACLLPFADGDETYLPGVTGWIDLDPADHAHGCRPDAEADPGPDHQALAVSPEELFVRIGAGAEARVVHVRRRDVLGVQGDPEFRFTGLGPWQTLAMSPIGDAAEVLRLRMKEVLGTALRTVLQIEVYPQDGEGPALTRTVVVSWPLDC